MGGRAGYEGIEAQLGKAARQANNGVQITRIVQRREAYLYLSVVLHHKALINMKGARGSIGPAWTSLQYGGLTPQSRAASKSASPLLLLSSPTTCAFPSILLSST